MSDTDALLDQASQGDASAISRLLNRHRDRLRQMVGIWMDPRVAARFDASDVVQETLVVAASRLPSYTRERPLPFYPWLRQLAWDQLVHYHRLHIYAQIRSVDREDEVWSGLSNHSTARLAEQLMASGTSASGRLSRRETQERMREALKRLSTADRKVLVLRFLEQLSVSDVAAILSISPEAVSMRQLRALRKLQMLMNKRR